LIVNVVAILLLEPVGTASLSLLFFPSSYWGKSYGGHDDVQTVFGQAILVAEFSPKKFK
jgi:hypothetical protein